MDKMKSINNIHREKPRGKALSVNELAELLDVTEQRIRQLQREGMPVFSQGGRGIASVYSSYDAIWWYIEYEQKKKRGAAPSNSDDNNNKQKLADMKVAAMELELARKRGTLFDLNDWGPFIKDKMAAFRLAMNNVVVNVREKFGGEVAKFVDREITRAINAYLRGLENVPNEVKE